MGPTWVIQQSPRLGIRVDIFGGCSAHSTFSLSTLFQWLSIFFMPRWGSCLLSSCVLHCAPCQSNTCKIFPLLCAFGRVVSSAWNGRSDYYLLCILQGFPPLFPSLLFTFSLYQPINKFTFVPAAHSHLMPANEHLLTLY